MSDIMAAISVLSLRLMAWTGENWSWEYEVYKSGNLS